MDYPHRLATLRAQLKKLKCDALVVTHLTNVRYLCGYTGTSGLVLVTATSVIFITDFRYRTQAQEQVAPFAHVAIADKGLWKEAAKIIKKEKLKRVGFESEHTSFSSWEEIKKLLEPAASPVSTLRAIEDLRLIKDDDELTILRQAVKIADDTLAEVLGMMRPGLSEREVAAAIETGVRSRGGSGLSFDTILASGTRGALPHGVASDKVLEHGDMVTIDMGARFNDYCSDMTRTVCLGRANAEQKKIYEITYRAQVAASEAMKPGLSCKGADAIARQIIDDAGFKNNFGHGLGHGVGIDIHEMPRLSRLGKGELKAGMIVTCEPGIYVPEFGGVRIEDMLLITRDGAEILTGTPKPARLLEL